MKAALASAAKPDVVLTMTNDEARQLLNLVLYNKDIPDLLAREGCSRDKVYRLFASIYDALEKPLESGWGNALR